MKVYKCSSGHIFHQWDDDPPMCWSCDDPHPNEECTVMDYNAIMDLAEEMDIGPGIHHMFADEALLLRMKELDPAFAERYEKVRRLGSWYFN